AAAVHSGIGGRVGRRRQTAAAAAGHHVLRDLLRNRRREEAPTDVAAQDALTSTMRRRGHGPHAGGMNMSSRIRFPVFVLAAALSASLVFRPVHAREAVDLELVLAVDVSGSIDEEEAILQRKGYIEALNHPQVLAAIKSGYHGRIAVIYIEWAGDHYQ